VKVLIEQDRLHGVAVAAIAERCALVSQKAVDDAKLIMTSREFSSWYEAEFSGEDEDQLIKWENIKKAQREANVKEMVPTQSILGVDVARFGKDRTYFVHLKFYEKLVAVEPLKWFEKQDTMQTVGKIKQFCEDHKVDKVVIDDTGIGGGVVDRLREFADFEPHIVPFISAGTPFTKEIVRRELFEHEKLANKKFLNRKTYFYNRLNWYFERQSIIIPKDPVLAAQLPAIHAGYTSDGKMKILDEKEQGKSPDAADALMMAVSGLDASQLAVELV
jgi:hypothetical protein